jgi:hypothetical protein
MERETGIEPATNGLGSRYSTIELLPLDLLIIAPARMLRQPRFCAHGLQHRSGRTPQWSGKDRCDPRRAIVLSRPV